MILDLTTFHAKDVNKELRLYMMHVIVFDLLWMHAKDLGGIHIAC